MTLDKTYHNGMQFNANYLWAKSMDINSLGSQGGLTTNGNFQDSNNPAGNYGLSDFDVRNHFAGTAIYNLPFKGNRWKEGFSLQGIFQYQTGNPVNLLASTSGYNGIAGNIRPNLLKPLDRRKIQLRVSRTFSTSRTRAASATYGEGQCL